MVIHGDKLQKNCEYIMKTWKTKTDDTFIQKRIVKFIKYTENGKDVSSESFDMLDLDLTKNQEAHFLDMSVTPHSPLVLKGDAKIWTLNDTHRITFSTFDDK
ncbi:hypothetical protein AA15669_0927 [Saccharibacter floricola DSM 15669]|uniref:Uncharacterized protein n=2 Tax=Saccharibacter TaxID=231052 RepID=A0ABQ0NY95_9PROT|nr:hypothetical protein AA15669_0927 [Saccharibacter floricola DSM 15669]